MLKPLVLDDVCSVYEVMPTFCTEAIKVVNLFVYSMVFFDYWQRNDFSLIDNANIRDTRALRNAK